MRDVVLLDTHPFPRDKTCGRGVSPKGIEVRRHAYPITGLRLVTPKGHEITLSGGTGFDAIVCLRRKLDHLILQRAQDAGVRFVPHFTAARLLTERGRVTGAVARDGREVRARITVIAGGTHCGLIPDRRPRKIIQAIMGWWEGVPFREHHVEMVFDPMVLSLYAWLFPEGRLRGARQHGSSRVSRVLSSEVAMRGTFPFFATERYPGSSERKRGMSPSSRLTSRAPRGSAWRRPPR